MITFDLGILAGSGPEAGMDLWHAILAERRARLGASYRGDVDAPSVLVRSDPRLGLSMDLETHGPTVRDVTIAHARTLDGECAAWAIACNTINRYAADVRAVGHGGALVDFTRVVDRWLETVPDARVALLGAAPVTALGAESAYRHLADRLVPLSADTRARLHTLIEDVKRVGPPFGDLAERFAELVAPIDADYLLLACTELPLVSAAVGESAVDVTRLVASAMLDIVDEVR